MSTETKHTPGPWNVDGRAIDSNTFEIAIILSDSDDIDSNIISEREWKANAQLISAAPDMLEALKVAVEAWEISNLNPDSKRLSQIKAAINKATGK